MSPSSRPELLRVSPAGCLKEDERYKLRIVTDSPSFISDVSVVVDGEEVAKGLAENRASYRNDDGTLLYVYAPTLLGGSGADGQILLLIYGFARIEVSLTFDSGEMVILESDDIPVLVRGNREQETERVDSMFDALFSAPPSQPLQWMLTGTPSHDERFSIVEGGATSPASRSVSTFLQVTDQVLSGFERLLPRFRSHVRSSIREVPTRVSGNKVRIAGAREAHWIATHPDLLQRSRVESGIRMGSGFYMPRFVQTDQRTRSYDTYENRLIVSFLSACGQRLGRLSTLIESERGFSESVERAMNPFSIEGYVFSSLLIASSGHRRREAVLERADSLRRKAATLEHAYKIAMPGVETGRFLPPRRSKVFQEVVPYTKLYELIMEWCAMGDLDIRGSLLALRTARMDRFYEYYVLLSILSRLYEHGFRPCSTIDSPIGVVEYSLSRTSRYFRNEGQVSNRYVLDGEMGSVTLYYQPVIYGDEREENGIQLHRTSVGARGHDSYYTPDFLLVFSSESGNKTVAIDAKYRYTQDVMDGVPESDFQKCLRKYRQETSGILGPPNAVWLLCGRDTEVETRYWERSSWSQSTKGYIRSGAMTLTPMGDGLNNLLEMIGILQQADGSEGPASDINAQTEAPELDLDTGATDNRMGEARSRSDSVSPAESADHAGFGNDVISHEATTSSGGEAEQRVEPIRERLPHPSFATSEERTHDSYGRSSDKDVALDDTSSKRYQSGGDVSRSRQEAVEPTKASDGPRSGKDGAGAMAGAEDLVRRIHELLGQDGSLLFEDGWSRANIGLGRPVLRDSKPSGKEASRYVPFSLGGNDVFLAKIWTPLNVNKAKMLIRRMSKQSQAEHPSRHDVSRHS